MNNLILGGAGFIGSNLSLLLDEENENMRIFDKVAPPLIEKINNKENFQVIIGEFNDKTDFIGLTEGIDYVYHLISTTIPSSSISVEKEILQNIVPTLKLLDACVKNKVKRVVFLSSGGTIYGNATNIHMEDDKTDPICSYGIQKLAIEKYLFLYKHKFGLDYRVVRLGNPYGRWQNPESGVGAITVFIYKIINELPITIYGDGNSIRDYIHIRDAVNGILKIAKYEGNYKVFNLGSGHGTSINEIINIISSNLSKTPILIYNEARDTDVKCSLLDINRYKDNLDIINFKSPEEGIREYIKHLKIEGLKTL